MTKKEAIAKLKNFADHCYPNEEFLMAIQALQVHYYDILNSYSYYKMLENMRDEINNIRRDEPDCSDLQFNDGLDEALQIIDKYIMKEGD